MRRRGAMAILAAIAAIMPAAAEFQTPQAPVCRTTGSLMRLAGLPEASGLTASVRAPGRLWAHNDSGRAVVYVAGEGGGRSQTGTLAALSCPR